MAMEDKDAGEEQTIQLSSVSILQLQAACPDRYEVTGLIGQGGMGMVFRAVDKLLNRDVAIKVFLFEGIRQEEAQERFFREAKAMAMLNHPNIVQIFSSGLNNLGNPYHVIELLSGESLSMILKSGPLSTVRFFDVFSQVLAGLEHAHHLQIVHRDLKPSNIMCCKNAEGNDTYKIIDFGIARIDMSPGQTARTITQTDALLGSPDYMSPEQCRGERGDQRSDIYSLGCIMYECIAGRAPFKGSSALDAMYKHMTEPSTRLDANTMSANSKQLASLVARCLEKDPELRPQTAEEIAAELAQISRAAEGEIDLFAGRIKSAGGSGIKAAFILVGIIALVILGTAVYLLKQSAGSSNKAAMAVTTSRLERLKAKCSNWAKRELSSLDFSDRRRYLMDLLFLGREQLKSKHKVDNADAEKTYSDALAFSKTTDGLKFCQPCCLVLRARSEWLQGKNKVADADFEQALSLINKEKLGAELLMDSYLERAHSRVCSRNFSGALSDYLMFSEIFRSVDKTVWELMKQQKLDKEGDDRYAMIESLAASLCQMTPQSEDEAVDMVKLANRLALALKKMRQKDQLQKTIKFSTALLFKIHGHEQLKQESNDEFDKLAN